MRINFNYLFIVIILLLNSCNNRNASDKISFKKNIRLKGVIEEYPNLFIGAPQKILISDSLLIIIDEKDKNCIMIINRNSKKIVSEFGRKGRGPNEISYLGDSWINERSNELEIFDQRNRIIYILSLDSLDKLDLKYAKKIILPKCPPEYKTLIYSSIFRISDSLLICSGLLETGRFALINHQGKYIKSFDDFDYYGNDFAKFNNVEKGIALQGNFTGSQSQGKLAFATSSSACFQVYEFQKELKVIKKVNYHISPAKRVGKNIGTDKSSPWGFSSIASSESELFLLYSGKSIAENENDFYMSDQIFVYDWKGNALKRLYLNIPLSMICYDKERKEFIGITQNPVPKIVSFKYNVK